MSVVAIRHYPNSFAFGTGLKEEYEKGLTVRDLVFLALDEQGSVYLGVCVDEAEPGAALRVGSKLAMVWPGKERVFHFDAIHFAAGEILAVNGDRRLRQVSLLFDVADLVARFARAQRHRSIFFGCTPHQPGSWLLTKDDTVGLHEAGYVELVPSRKGVLARRIYDEGLYFLDKDGVVADPRQRWQRIYHSPLGCVLMVERRIKHGRLALSCQDGLIELDVSDLPQIKEVSRIEHRGGNCILGRTSDGLFALSHGRPQNWGYEDLQPAQLVLSPTGRFADLQALLVGPK
jgi:hypothetical protein